MASGKDIFDLYAMVVHHGRGFDVGHFTSFGRPPAADGSLGRCVSPSRRTPLRHSPRGSTWLLFNDTNVRVAKDEEVRRALLRPPRIPTRAAAVEKAEPYLLFFKRR